MSQEPGVRAPITRVVSSPHSTAARPVQAPLRPGLHSVILAADPLFSLNLQALLLFLNSYLTLFFPSLEIGLLLPTSRRTVPILQVALVALRGLCQTSSHAPFPLSPPPSQRSGHTDCLGAPPQSLYFPHLCAHVRASLLVWGPFLL